MKQIAHKIGLVAATASTFLWTAAAYAAPTPEGLNVVGSISVMEVITNIINFLLLVAGGLAVVYLIYAGIMYIVGGAKGDADAKKMIINALTGVVIIVLSYVLVNAVIGLVQSGSA